MDLQRKTGQEPSSSSRQDYVLSIYSKDYWEYSYGARDSPDKRLSKSEDQDRGILDRSMKTLLKSMDVMGLVHPIQIKNMFVSKTRKRISFVNSVIKLIIHWINVLRFFWMYDPVEVFGPSLFLKIIFHVLFFQCAVCATICTIRFSRLPTFFRKWEDYLYVNYSDIHRRKFVNKMYKRCLVAVVVSWFVTTVSMIDIVVSIILDTEVVKKLLLPVTHLWPNAFVIMKYIYIPVHGLFVATWIFPLCFFVVLTLGIRDNFVHLTRDLRKSTRNLEIIERELESFRRRHECLCKLVFRLDSLISVYNFTVYATNIPLCCFMIYALFYGAADIDVQLLGNLLVVILCMLMSMSVITATATSLNTAVRHLMHTKLNYSQTFNYSYFSLAR